MKKIFFLLSLAVSAITVVGQTSAKNTVTDKIPETNCDNTVHNKLPADASDRSPSECEVQFDWKVRTALRDVFSKALENFSDKDWVISDTAVKVLGEVGKASEKYFFNLSYYFKIDANSASEVYKDWSKKMQAQMEELKNPKEDSYKKFADFNYKMNNALHINFYVRVNNTSDRIYFFKSGQQVINVPGAAYAVKGTHAGSLSGGGEENSMDACLIVLGKPKVSVQKEDDGSTSVIAENNFPKGVSRLTVQEISIRIECNDELLNRLLKEIDLAILRNLIVQ